MKNFNFYINVDQCLNMSNFDMFFYKLQHDQKFYLTNVNFNGKEGMNTLNDAVHDIRSYIDRAPFLITNYRLIFGMRTRRKKQQDIRWRDTVLYRLLTIYYTLKEQKLFIKSKEAADKNVSVIMLYETDFTLDMPELLYYESIDDINVLIKEAGIDINTVKNPGEIQDGLNDYLERLIGSRSRRKKEDFITRVFLTEYLEYMEKKKASMNSEVSEELKLYELRQRENEEEYLNKKRQSWLHSLNQFVKHRTEHYCVFIKEIDHNSLDQNLMALLSIVDYITSDLDYEGDDELQTNESLRQLSEDNWRRSTNDKNIRDHYSKMMFFYNQRLLEAADFISRKERDLENGQIPAVYEKPEQIEDNTRLAMRNREAYHNEITKLIHDFGWKSLIKKRAEEEWKHTYSKLKEKLANLETELSDYARRLTVKYKKEISQRKADFGKERKSYGYSLEAIDNSLIEDYRQKDKLLEELKKPHMNSALMFQDQLNLENQLESSNSEIRFYVKCLKMIQTVNFLILILAGGGLFLSHYLLMQNYVFGNSQMILAMLGYILVTFFLFFPCWLAPYRYFQKKIQKALRVLHEATLKYIDGYFKKAQDFASYINVINEMDVLSSHIALLENYQRTTRIYARKMLWHKVKVKEHISKASYFENMYATMDVEKFYQSEEERITQEPKIDFTSDVIDNWVYWPQEGLI